MSGSNKQEIDISWRRGEEHFWYGVCAVAWFLAIAGAPMFGVVVGVGASVFIALVLYPLAISLTTLAFFRTSVISDERVVLAEQKRKYEHGQEIERDRDWTAGGGR